MNCMSKRFQRFANIILNKNKLKGVIYDKNKIYG